MSPDHELAAWCADIDDDCHGIIWRADSIRHVPWLRGNSASVMFQL